MERKNKTLDYDLSFLAKLTDEQWIKLFGDPNNDQPSGLIQCTQTQVEILNLRFREGNTQRQVAHEMGFKYESVRRLEQRAKQKLVNWYLSHRTKSR